MLTFYEFWGNLNGWLFRKNDESHLSLIRNTIDQFRRSSQPFKLIKNDRDCMKGTLIFPKILNFRKIMRSRAQLREIDISSYLRRKKVLPRSHNVVEAFAKLLRKRQALMPKMVVAGHLAITFLLSLLFLRARSAFTSPRLPHRIAGDTSKWVVSARPAQTIVVVASLNFRKTPKGLPTFSSRSTYQDTSIDGVNVTRVLAGLGTGRIHRCAVCNRGSCNAITCWIPDHRRIVTAPRLGGSDTRSFSPSVFLSLSVPFFLSILLYFLLLSLSLSYSVSDFVRSESTPYPLEMYSERCDLVCKRSVRNGSGITLW